MKLIIRLWVVELIQIMLLFDNQVRGISIIVGTTYFNIGVNLSFEHNQCHTCLKPLPIVINPVLLRKQRKLVK